VVKASLDVVSRDLVLTALEVSSMLSLAGVPLLLPAKHQSAGLTFTAASLSLWKKPLLVLKRN
jgi:hypothetical protein